MKSDPKRASEWADMLFGVNPRKTAEIMKIYGLKWGDKATQVPTPLQVTRIYTYNFPGIFLVHKGDTAVLIGAQNYRPPNAWGNETPERIRHMLLPFRAWECKPGPECNGVCECEDCDYECDEDCAVCYEDCDCYSCTRPSYWCETHQIAHPEAQIIQRNF